VVRLSGPDATGIAERLTGPDRDWQPWRSFLGTLTDEEGNSVDHVVVTYFRKPNSYTAEDVVEISCHGSPVVLTHCVQRCCAFGARPAEPGEFTLRAFLHGRIDLVQAEAVRDLIDAVTPLQARAAYDQLEGTLTAEIAAVDRGLFDLTVRLEASLDFPDEGYHFVESGDAAREIAGIMATLDSVLAGAARGRLVREGLQVVLAGRPNAGKSSLFNCLAGAGRAIVTATPGTTRDLVTETIEVEGIPMTVVDTAGVHGDAADPIELEGIARAVAARDIAHLVVVVLDRSRSLDADDRTLLAATAGRARVVVANKADLPAAWNGEALDGAAPVVVSAATGQGVDHLRAALVVAAAGEATRDVPAITNVRHVDLLTSARTALDRALGAARTGTPEEFVLADLNEARRRLEEVTGARTSDDVLHEIFARFCIGK
jgi:tRNA modification GTPase